MTNISQRFTHKMAAKTAGIDMKQNYVTEIHLLTYLLTAFTAFYAAMCAI